MAIKTQPLTQKDFAPFGEVIENPLAPDVNSIPSTPPTSTIPFKSANQDTALKASPISSFQNDYSKSSTGSPGKPVMSMFACFPRTLDKDPTGKPIFRVRILERHPFTTQTFVPMGLAPGDPLTRYLVIVAATLDSKQTSRQKGPPDLQNVRAFIANGRQAVTYGVGTWHAPMVVIGEKRVDFVVVQSINGIPEDDCQEVDVEDDIDTSVEIVEMTKSRASKL
ncbi:ureidoglycolate lyase [Physcia stellaris]|nr:ureidoglycolate lyase [Physcia stellaris]